MFGSNIITLIEALIYLLLIADLDSNVYGRFHASFKVLMVHAPRIDIFKA